MTTMRRPIDRTHTDVMVEAAIRFAERFPTVTEHSIAKNMGWRQVELQRALASRGLSLPSKGQRYESITDLIRRYAYADRVALNQLLVDLEGLMHAAETGELE